MRTLRTASLPPAVLYFDFPATCRKAAAGFGWLGRKPCGLLPCYSSVSYLRWHWPRSLDIRSHLSPGISHLQNLPSFAGSFSHSQSLPPFLQVPLFFLRPAPIKDSLYTTQGLYFPDYIRLPTDE